MPTGRGGAAAVPGVLRRSTRRSWSSAARPGWSSRLSARIRPAAPRWRGPARLSASAAAAALRVLAEHGLAERGLAERGGGGWRRGPVALDAAAEVIGAAGLHRERTERYDRDRASWRARLRQYQGVRHRPVSAGDGWWSLDDPDEYDELSRWPVILDDSVRAPPAVSTTAATALLRSNGYLAATAARLRARRPGRTVR
jgi:hypothetical protein